MNQMDIAIHEAAHAICAVATGAIVESISTGPYDFDPDFAPHGYIKAFYECSDRGDLSLAIVDLAGYAGEWWYQTDGNANVVRSSLCHAIVERLDCADFRSYSEVSRKIQRQQRGAVRHSMIEVDCDLIEKTIRLVKKHWPAIEYLAEQLAQCERIEGELLQEILAEAMAIPQVA